MTLLSELETPCLLLDEPRMRRNIERLKARLAGQGVSFRPHIKTAKSLPVARLLLPRADGPVTVSTLKEADVLAAAGITDILYAVGISPAKLPHVVAVRARGVDLKVLCDSVAQAEAINACAQSHGAPIPTLIEIDADGHRAGVRAASDTLLAVGRVLARTGSLRGVLAHAGEFYNARSLQEIADFAEKERAATVGSAKRLVEAGLPCDIVSVGSTPTAHLAKDLSGVSEVRAGVFVFFDLIMAGLGVCRTEDIALSVLSTVLGHQHQKGWLLLDAGWMAMSRDRGTAKQATDQGYGLVCDLAGRPYPDLILIEANQEHGIAALRSSSQHLLPALPVGARVRILPNHACATGAQHDRYHVMHGSDPSVQDVWERFRGW